MKQAEFKVCGKCGREVLCEYDGENYVGQCTWCGQFKAYQYCPKEEEPKPKVKPKLLGVQVDWWDDDPERGRGGSKTFEDPDEGCDYAKELESKHYNTIVWPIWEELE